MRYPDELRRAAQSCRFTAEDDRSGAIRLELLSWIVGRLSWMLGQMPLKPRLPAVVSPTPNSLRYQVSPGLPMRMVGVWVRCDDCGRVVASLGVGYHKRSCKPERVREAT